MAVSAGAIRFGKAFVEIFADDSKLVRGLRVAEKKVRAIGNSMASAGRTIMAAAAIPATAIAGAVTLFTKMGSDLADMSARTGVSVEALSELGYAAQMAGTDAETLEGALNKLAKFMVNPAAADELGKLGLAIGDLAGLSPDKQLEAIGAAIAAIPNPTNRAAAAMEIFGKSGTKLLPMLADLVKLKAEARAFGLVISSEDAAAADELGDSLDRVKSVGKAAAFYVGAALARSLTTAANAIAMAGARLAKWISANREVVLWAGKLIAITAATGAALFLIGKITAIAAGAFGLLATAITAVAASMAILKAVFLAVVSPLGLLTVLLTAAGAALLYFTGYGGELVKWFGDRFRGIADTVRSALAGIGDALAAGDLGLAMRVGWTAVKVELAKGNKELVKAWVGLKRNLYPAMNDLADFMLTSWAEIMKGMSNMVDSAADLIGRGLNEIWYTGALAVNFYTAALRRAIVTAKALLDPSIDLNKEYDKINRDEASGAIKAENARNRESKFLDKMKNVGNRRAKEERERALSAIMEASADRQSKWEPENEAQIQAAQDELDQAKRDFNWELMMSRHKATMAADADLPSLPKATQLPRFDEAASPALAARSSVSGTFSGAALQGLGSNSTQERIARATEEVVRGVNKIGSTLVFS